MPTFTQTIIDNFDDNSISTYWNAWSTGVAETGGQMRVTSATTSDTYCGVETAGDQ